MEHSGSGQAFLSGSIRIRVMLALVACLAQPGCYSVTRTGAPEPAAMLETLGNVSVLRVGKPLRPRPELRLQPGDEVATDVNGYAVIRYASGASVYLKPDTRVRVGSIFVVFGEVFARAKELFRVDTDFVTAGVEGTEFSLQANRMGLITVTVREGIVVCSSMRGRWAPVRMQNGERLVAVQEQTPEVTKVPGKELRSETGWVDDIEARLRQKKKPSATP